jgi:hypothetical protein
VTGSGRCGVFAKFLLATYVLAAALLPLAHHDIVCHLKSTTHCTSCVVASSGETAPGTMAVDGLLLPDAGGASLPPSESSWPEQVRTTSGRSPPARS